MKQTDFSIGSLPVMYPLEGVCTAILVPRHRSGEPNLEAVARQVDFLQSRGITSIAVNGATGEYIRSSYHEVLAVARLVRERLHAGNRLIVAATGADRTSVQKLLHGAKEVGADGILLPVPYYFPYTQQDVIAFVKSLQFDLPTYLYNLPSFTTPLEAETVLHLCQQVPHIVGVKDSSGKLEIVSLLKQEVSLSSCIIGNDGALYEALARGVCHGVVSGVSCVLPELMLRFYTAAHTSAQTEEVMRLASILQEYIRWLERFPVPWGLKITAEARGLEVAEFALPLSPERAQDKEYFLRWITHHAERLLIS